MTLPIWLADASSSWLSRLGGVVEQVFGGDAPHDDIMLYQVAARALLVYIVGVIIVRLGKSRMFGRVTALDVILIIILGSLLGRAITGDASLSGTAAAAISMVAAHWLMTRLAYHSHEFGKIFKGHAHMVIKDGQVQHELARKSHLSDHDLMEGLRLKGVGDPQQVKEAWKERSGEISVIPRREPGILDIHVRDGVQTVRIEIV